MNQTEQGVLKAGERMRLFVHMLLLSIFCITHNVSAQTPEAEKTTHEKIAQQHHAYIIYSPDNALHANIVKKLSRDLQLRQPDIIISEITPQEKITITNPAAGIVIGIGGAGIRSATEHYPQTKKLFITTDPNRYQLKINAGDAVLYMTQPYCRQINFIRQINARWKTISILSSRKKPVDSKPIQQCAEKYGFRIHTVNTTAKDNLTNKIKDALRNSDVLLALPDSSIYNSRTVKNILLTSYRYRKPVIAFSKNFVNAGALASIHSNTEQIAHSASQIIEQYFNAGTKFKEAVNHPDSFDIDINKQVFRALDLPPPDTEKLKKLLHPTTDNDAEDRL